MIKGMHGMFYSTKADELRSFLKDKLGLKANDIGGGWLIYDLPMADLGVHPTEDRKVSGTHDLSFFTDDLKGTVKDLKKKGVKFDDELTDRGYGFVIHLTMPGNVKVQLYQPKYDRA